MANSSTNYKLKLEKLIEKSNVTFTAEEVIREFGQPYDKISTRALLKRLRLMTRHLPRSKEYVLNIAKHFEKDNRFECLLKFLNNIPESEIVQPPSLLSPYATVTTSSPLGPVMSIGGNSSNKTELLIPKLFDSAIPDDVSEIKERVVQAATEGLSKSVQSTTSTPTVTNTTNMLFPAVNKNRACLVWDYRKLDLFPFQPTNIAAVPINSQENIVLYELIYCLTGIRGTYIIPEEINDGGETIVRFKISEQVHSSLRDIASEILPLASNYICIQKFIQRASFSDCGQVLQALSAALRSLIHDYYLLLSQLESELIAGQLTLHKMLFYVRPTLNTMSVLTDSVKDICKSDLRGGQALTLLFDRISSLTGDEESQRFLIQLTQLAAVPYMEILQLWIQKGVINDPQQEFLVEDNEVIRREELPEHYSADYWERRYTIRRERIPRFLEKVSDIILRTGKYLNVIRQCGKKVTPPQTVTLHFSAINQNYITVIQNAYKFASKTLLEVLLKENDLMGHLMSVKRYLLLSQGDFITQFMDSCEEELSKNVEKVLPMKLENLLGLTLRLSSAKNDPYKDDVHCEFLPYDLATQMSKIINNEEDYWQMHDRIDLTGLECFAFRYEVKWPVSLVLNHIAISKYQMLFRQLFYCKHVERQLCKIWKENSGAKNFTAEDSELYRFAFTLRQRMMNAIQNLEYYMMIEVIEPNWHIFIENMSKVENVDDVLIVHQDFLDLCVKNCMLTDPTLLRSIIKLSNICLKFCEFTQNFQQKNNETNEIDCVDRESLKSYQSGTSASSIDDFSDNIRRYDLEFTGLLIGLLKQINDVASDNPSDRFINLVHRINFNSFYNEQMDKLCAKDAMMP